jgi:hypothetical protein
MWRHLLDEDGWAGEIVGTANRSGYRNFSEKCDSANCSSNVYELFLPDRSILRP